MFGGGGGGLKGGGNWGGVPIFGGMVYPGGWAFFRGFGRQRLFEG